MALGAALLCTGAVQAEEDSWETAKTTPYGRYPETVVCTLGKMINAAYSGMPEGDTYVNNAYTRYVKEKLNVEIDLTLSADSPSYTAMAEMAVTNGEIPDVMVIEDADLLQKMVENDMIEDLTPYYESCFSDRIKEIYDSYGGSCFSMATFDGKIYAIPETDIDTGANFIWLRKDWMNELGLEDPKTLEDVEEIIRQFLAAEMGGEGQTVGLLCDKSLVADTTQCYNAVPVFMEYGAYPGIWVPQEDGTIVYGTTLPETKEALSLLRRWYQEGILDQQFLLRNIRNNASLVENGRSGSFFGWWWAPNNPLQAAVASHPEQVWQPYLISNTEDGAVVSGLTYETEKYVVVRKGYEHPVLVMKIMSLVYDYARYEDKEATEIQEYFSRSVDPTATPFVVNCDYRDAIQRTTGKLQSVLEGEEEESTLNTLERGYYNSCVSWLGDQESKASEWAAYTSRITAVGQLMETEVTYINEGYSRGFCGIIPDALLEFENEYLLKIIIGENSLSSFDDMVESWYARGGSEATKQAQEIYERILEAEGTETFK